LFIPDSDSTPPYHLLTVGVISFSRLRFGRIRAKCGSVFKVGSTAQKNRFGLPGTLAYGPPRAGEITA